MSVPPARPCIVCGADNPWLESRCVECGEWSTNATNVIFRVFPANYARKEPDVVALIPEVPWGSGQNFCVGHFAWSGGGMETHYAKTMRKRRAAAPEEYAGLKSLLEDTFGYRLSIVSRSTPAMNDTRRKRAAANET